MPQLPYSIPKRQYTTETVINKSCFITTLRRIKSLSEMREMYLELQQQHTKANHNCWAVIAGAPADSQGYGFSDDGEPNSTAGKPIFNVLHHSGVGQTGLIVTRYFGGIKLGKGGLVRAYTESAQMGLDGATFTTFSKKSRLICTFAYDQEPVFRYFLDQHNLQEADFSYSEVVTVQLFVNEASLMEITERLQTRLASNITLQLPTR